MTVRPGFRSQVPCSARFSSQLPIGGPIRPSERRTDRSGVSTGGVIATVAVAVGALLRSHARERTRDLASVGPTVPTGATNHDIVRSSAAVVRWLVVLRRRGAAIDAAIRTLIVRRRPGQRSLFLAHALGCFSGHRFLIEFDAPCSGRSRETTSGTPTEMSDTARRKTFGRRQLAPQSIPSAYECVATARCSRFGVPPLVGRDCWPPTARTNGESEVSSL